MENFIVLDIETTGLDAKLNGMVSLGAVDFKTSDVFYGECHVDESTIIDDFAMGVNGFTIAQIREFKDSSYDLYTKFLKWSNGRATLLGGQQVGSFDILFLKEIHKLLPKDIKWPFGHRSLDLHSVAFAKSGKSLSLDGILEYVGLKPEPKPHNALVGATLEREAFKLLGIGPIGWKS